MRLFALFFLCLTILFWSRPGRCEEKVLHPPSPETASPQPSPVGGAKDEQTVLTLETAIQVALSRHPLLREAYQGVKGSEARAEGAGSSFYPTIGVESDYSRSKSGGTVGVGGFAIPARGGKESDLFTNQFSLRATIYDFGKRRHRLSQNLEEVKGAEWHLRKVRQDLILSVKQAYYAALQAQDELRVQQESNDQFKGHLTQAEGFFAVGKKSKIEVTKARVDLANARVNLVKAEHQMMLSLSTLNHSMGLNVEVQGNSRPYLLQEPPLQPLSADLSATTLQGSLKLGLERREDLQELRAKSRALEEALEVSRRGSSPVLSSSATYGWRDSTFIAGKPQWSLGVSLNYPFFDGFLTPAQRKESEAALKQLQAGIQELELTLSQEVEEAYLSLQEARERVTLATVAVEQAQENFQLAEARYDVGVGSPIEFTDAQVSLTTARVNLLKAKSDERLALAKLQNAVGGGE